MLPKVFAYTVISAASMKDVFCTSSILAIQLSLYTGHTPLLWCFSRGCHCNIVVLCHISTAVMRTDCRGHYCSTVLPKTVPRGTTNAKKQLHVYIPSPLAGDDTSKRLLYQHCFWFVDGFYLHQSTKNRERQERQTHYITAISSPCDILISHFLSSTTL